MNNKPQLFFIGGNRDSQPNPAEHSPYELGSLCYGVNLRLLTRPSVLEHLRDAQKSRSLTSISSREASRTRKRRALFRTCKLGPAKTSLRS